MKLKIETKEFIFLSLWFIFSFSYILNASLFTFISIFKIAYKLELIAFSGILFLLFFTHRKFNIKKLLLSSILAVGILIISKRSGSMVMIAFILFVINSDFSTVKRILKVSMISLSISVLFVILMCKIGLLEDYIFVRDDGARAHSFGFAYYYNISAYFMFLSIMYLYYKEKVKWIEIVGMAGISFVIYKLCTTRLPLLIMLCGLTGYVFVYKLNILKTLNHKLIKVYSLIAFPAVCFICSIAAIKYNPNNPTFANLNKILNHRLSLSNYAFNTYGVKLLGQSIEMNGNDYNSNKGVYFFLDSGYIISVIEYGLIATLILLVIYSLIYYYSCKANNKRLFVWISVTLIYNIVNGCWTALVYNPLFFFIMFMDRNIFTELLRSLKQNKRLCKIIEKLPITEET